MSANWVDLTNKGDKYRPSALTLDIPHINVLVQKNTYKHDGEWVLICHPFYDHKKIKAEDVDEVKQEVIDLIYKALNEIIAEI